MSGLFVAAIILTPWRTSTPSISTSSCVKILSDTLELPEVL